MGKTTRKRKRKVTLPDVEKREDATCHLEIKSESLSPATEKLQNKKRKREARPLNGLVLAISTLDVKGQKHTSSDSSYQAVAALCTELGAKVTPQVHKKVFAVICNTSAVNQLTQRVRKALKRKLSLLIDVEWIRQCKAQCDRVDHEKYLLDELAKTVMAKKEDIGNQQKNHTVTHHLPNDDDAEENTLNVNEGWSEAVSLDCCCVCHETDRNDCKWCVDCNVTLAKTSKSIKN
mmetsp:Transcript_18484/g.22638  ORF Transcript_18484/g.22638 Transcript_18484/m.22638 type:complete len:234 (+) Transcript_18484:124-825(+)